MRALRTFGALIALLLVTALHAQGAFYWNTFKLDNFAYSNGNLTGNGSWATEASLVTLSVVSNTIECASIGGDDCGNTYGATFPNDQCSQVKILTLNAVDTAAVEVGVRASTSANTYYAAFIKGPLGTSAQVLLGKVVAGAVTTLVAYTTETINSGDLVGICAQGSTLYVTIRGTLVPAFTQTDTTITAGVPKIGIESNGQAETDVIIGNWSGFYLGTTVAGAGGGGGSLAVKWHPGPYMNSSVFTTVGNLDFNGNPAGSQKAAEINIVRNGPAAVKGWDGYYTWSAFYNSGTLDCSTAGSGFDADYVLATGYVSGSTTSAVYNAPRRVAITILQTYFFSASPGKILPSYISTNSTYGPVAPSGGLYGWWTTNGLNGDGSTVPGGGAVLALWRPAVMAQFQAFHTALGAHVLPDGWTVDTSPYIEWVNMVEETATIVPTASGCSGTACDSTYSLSGLVTQLQNLNSTALSAYPHTNRVSNANYLDTTGSYVASLPGSQTALGGPDIIAGLSQGNNVPALTWGQGQYIGLVPPGGNPATTPWNTGGTNQIGIIPYIANEESDLITFSSKFTSALDLFNQANSTLQVTHLSWGYAPAGCSPNYACWFGNAANQSAWTAGGDTANGVLTTIVNHTLSNTACPSAYLHGCNTSMRWPVANNDHFHRLLDGDLKEAA